MKVLSSELDLDIVVLCKAPVYHQTIQQGEARLLPTGAEEPDNNRFQTIIVS
jgi:hypothetical protein